MSKISFTCDLHKTVEVLLWVMGQSKEGVNLYNLVKTIFHADCYHLNNYGRPVTGDHYIAMDHGTVPSWVYDLLKHDPFTLCDAGYELGGQTLPFEAKGNMLVAKRPFNPDFLSESDIEALQQGFKEYGTLSFHEVRNKNHSHPAWKKYYFEQPIKKFFLKHL
ncbi:MAG: SocA family protein [Alphaproteobacteria bacterium]|nr:SocA family protein [Alphaproteobacteria bacterium]OJV45450.1 MAG: hypothetical protein BGO28_04970 [Alphaproteobacteria bacterium 43-37]